MFNVLSLVAVLITLAQLWRRGLILGWRLI
jgi:hypothetical protein